MALPSNIHDRRYYSYVTVGSVQTAKRIIDTLHQKVHEGDLYNASYFATVLNAGTLDILIRTGAAIFPHIGFEIESGGDTELHIYEGADIAAVGTAIPIFNIKRSSTNTPDSTVYHTPTVTTTGTSIYDNYIIGGEKNKAFGGGNGSLARGAPEWNFKNNTDYLIRLINQASVDIIMTFNTTFYEAAG